jgi:excinuclease UvrABC ATPase subunit
LAAYDNIATLAEAASVPMCLRETNNACSKCLVNEDIKMLNLITGGSGSGKSALVREASRNWRMILIKQVISRLIYIQL